MCALIVGTGVVAAALMAAMAFLQSRPGLEPFQLRFNPTFAAQDLKDRIGDHERGAALTIVPLLYPLDLLFMVCAASFMGLLSLQAFGSTVSAPWLLVLPALYLVFDFSENALYAYLLAHRDMISAGNVTALQWMTRLKWISVVFALPQIAWALVRCLGAR